MKRYYAHQYASGRKTTTGEPNPRTGRMSIAGELRSFPTAQLRDEWVSRGKITPDMQGNCREAVTIREARRLRAGMSPERWDDYREYLRMQDDH